MVQITNTLVAAALIVPALAAPVLESREPKGLRSFGRIAGKVAGGASLGLTVGGMLQGREEQKLEAREPRLTGAQVKTIAHGALAIGKTAKSAIEFGVTAAPLLPHRKQRREFEEVEARDDQLDARRLRVSPSTLRTIGHGLAGAAGFAGTVALLNTQKPQQRDFEDNELLDARRLRVSPSTLKTIGHGLAGAAGFAGTVAVMNTQKPQQRDFEDKEHLNARRFPLVRTSGHVDGLIQFPGNTPIADYQKHGRDFDEYLNARDPRFSMGGIVKTAGRVAKTAGKVAMTFLREDEMDLAERDYDEVEVELSARDPKFSFGKVFKTVGKVASNFIREDDVMDLAERDFDDAETLNTREPGLFGGVLKLGSKVVKHFIRDDETGDIYVIRQAVDMDELD